LKIADLLKLLQEKHGLINAIYQVSPDGRVVGGELISIAESWREYIGDAELKNRGLENKTLSEKSLGVFNFKWNINRRCINDSTSNKTDREIDRS
jgi:hypothetical protein